MPLSAGPKPPEVVVPPGVAITDLIDHFGLELVTDAGRDLNRPSIKHARPNRPGRIWSDLVGHQPSTRLLLIGAVEWSALLALSVQERHDRLRMLAALDVPAVVLARGLPLTMQTQETLESGGVPVLRTSASTGDFAGDLIWFLQLALAPRAIVHAGLVDVNGVGVLILGRSGIGKSECALELIRRGHRLIADDTVEVRRPTEHELIGRAPGRMRHFMEVKGIGIVNLRTMYGIGAVKSSGDVEMAVYLVPDDGAEELALGPDRMDLLSVDLPLVTIPLRPGRNAAVLVEAAATTLRARSLRAHDVHRTHFENRADMFDRLR
jgi:HPr kinase/phosphorylase